MSSAGWLHAAAVIEHQHGADLFHLAGFADADGVDGYAFFLGLVKDVFDGFFAVQVDAVGDENDGVVASLGGRLQHRDSFGGRVEIGGAAARLEFGDLLQAAARARASAAMPVADFVIEQDQARNRPCAAASQETPPTPAALAPCRHARSCCRWCPWPK